jgi:hypothetical protein
MFTDQKRAQVQDEIRRHDHPLFAHLLTPDLFLQAALQCGLKIVCSPLNLINLVWLALSAARNPAASFASLLGLPLKILQDHQAYASSPLGRRLGSPRKARKRKPKKNRSRHDPRGGAVEAVSEEAFVQARRRMPTDFWVALFLLLGQRFQEHHGQLIRWRRFRLLAVDGTRLDLPDWPALRQHFGTAANALGNHGAQARLVLVQFPLARLPYAYALAPLAQGETTLARQLLQGLGGDDLVLLDAGFLCYGLLCQIQGASFCLRLHKRLNLRTIKQLRKDTGADDVLVEWTPKDSRGQWRKQKCPKSMTLRLLTYHAKGFRPLRLLTNVLDPHDVPYKDWWGLSVSEQGKVLGKGVYNLRWEIETTYLELKVQQGLEGGIRSRTPEGVEYEVAGHVLHYLLVRWLLVEAAVRAKVSPLRLSFTEALREINALWPSAVVADEAWRQQTLLPRLYERLACHRVPERPGRTAPRGAEARRARRGPAKKGRRARKARRSPSGRPKKAKPRGWFGRGWDLKGRRIPMGPPPEG